MSAKYSEAEVDTLIRNARNYEREACAKLISGMAESYDDQGKPECAIAIRSAVLLIQSRGAA